MCHPFSSPPSQFKIKAFCELYVSVPLYVTLAFNLAKQLAVLFHLSFTFSQHSLLIIVTVLCSGGLIILTITFIY